MNQYDELFSVGKDIMDAVNRAVEGNDYSGLTQNLNRQVVNLTEELNKYNARNNGQRNKSFGNTSTVRRTTSNDQRPAYIRQNTTVGNTQKFTPFKQALPGYLPANMKTALGAAGMVSFGGGLLTEIMLLAVYGSSALFPTIALLIPTVLCGRLIVKGIKERKLIDKYYKYARLVGDEEYIPIAKLAKLAGESEKDVLQNIDKMMEKGYLPKARLDADKKTLMLTREVYNQYLQTAEQKQREKKLQEAKEDEISRLNVSAEVKEIMRNGNKFVDRIQKYNDEIPDETMTAKLNDLKAIVNRIFSQVKKNPNSAGDLRKLMNYYLPTTEKLLDAYVDLDKQPQTSANVVKTKKEIEGAIDTINEAFNNLFDSMFEDVAWDISSDISAMKTMMAQDGLTESAVKARR